MNDCIEEITWMELHIAAPYLRIPEHLLDLLQKKETVPRKLKKIA
jgi:8-oxo-dGTP diphosphatase